MTTLNQKTIKSPFGITIQNTNDEANLTNETISINPESKTNKIQHPFENNQVISLNTNDDMQDELTGTISLTDNPNKNGRSNNKRDSMNYGDSGYDELNEPPLLEDLGIDIQNIKMKTFAVLTLKKCDNKFLQEADMSGPLLLAFVFGGLLLLSGKIHFGYIYGFGILGCIAIYMLMNLLSQIKNIELYNTVSILGYCLMPIVMLAALNVPLNLRNTFGFITSFGSICWATITATNFFEGALQLKEQKWLIAYPIFLFYLIFVLITIF